MTRVYRDNQARLQTAPTGLGKWGTGKQSAKLRFAFCKEVQARKAED